MIKIHQKLQFFIKDHVYENRDCGRPEPLRSMQPKRREPQESPLPWHHCLNRALLRTFFLFGEFIKNCNFIKHHIHKNCDCSGPEPHRSKRPKRREPQETLLSWYHSLNRALLRTFLQIDDILSRNWKNGQLFDLQF